MKKNIWLATAFIAASSMVATGCPAKTQKQAKAALAQGKFGDADDEHERDGIGGDVDPTPSGSSETPPVAAPPPPAPAGAALSISQVPAQSMNLGTSKAIIVQVRAANNFSGPVTFSLDRSMLNTADAAGDIVTSVNPPSATLAAGQSVDVTVNVNVTTMSPSFAASKLRLVAASGASQVFTDIDLAVNAVYEVQMNGGNVPEGSVGGVNVSLRKHMPGLVVRFLKPNDTLTHRVHSAGLVPHQGTPGTANYEVTVPGTAAAAAVRWYCHVHEANAQARTINLNTQ